MKIKSIKIDYFLYSILFLLPFIHINIGINISDQGYNLANFELFPDINETWRIATLMANLIGKVFTYLPFGHYMLGMNIYCTLLLSLTMVGIFFFLKKEYSKYAVFGGLILAICMSWAPKVALYQYVSYYLLSFALIVLVMGLKNDQKKYMFLAGVILGINLFVRFPNILQVTLIFLVFYAAILYKKKIKVVCQNCVCCIAGYVLVALLGIVLVEVVFGKGAYLSMIENLFGMTDTATSYSPSYMIQSMLASYIENWKWFRWFLGLAIFAVIVGSFRMKKWMTVVFYITICGLFLIILRILWYYGKINLKYNSYDSIHTMGAVFLLLAVFVLLGVIIKSGIEVPQKLYAMAALLIMIITPLGSNNVLYTNYNNLYIIAPVVLSSISVLFADIKRDRNKLWQFHSLPIKIVAYMLIGIVVFQAFMFHIFFVYGSSGMLNESKAEISNNTVLKWMRTSEENAEMLNGLNNYILENDLRGKKCIVYSNAPLVFYAFELDCAIGHTWPALDSYPNNEYVSDIQTMETYPIVIYETRYFDDLMKEVPEWDNKAFYINQLLIEGSYKEVYRNDHYAVCIPEGYDL